jgi:hypothetical protein
LVFQHKTPDASHRGFCGFGVICCAMVTFSPADATLSLTHPLGMLGAIEPNFDEIVIVIYLAFIGQQDFIGIGIVATAF